MKSIMMAIMAVAVAVTFSAPAFAADKPVEKKDEKKGGHVLVYEEKKDEKKAGEKGKGTDTFGEKEAEKKKDEKGK
jgi:hypothetical protein